MYFRPAEWTSPKTIMLAWPWDIKLWQQHLVKAQQEFIELIYALKNERITILVPHEPALKQLKAMLPHHTSFLLAPYGDIWIRDTAPILVKDQKQRIKAVLPQFNGWGNKYLFADDVDLSKRLATALGYETINSSLVLEGGAIETDGLGTLITTEQCLLNKNRNPTLTKKEIEKEFFRMFGSKHIIWIKEGLKNDHTDGHIDTLMRFISPKQLVIMMPTDNNDPNYTVLLDIKKQLLATTNVHGEKFEIIEIPSPGKVVDSDKKLMPASYVNFIIGENTLVVPTYRKNTDEQVIKILSQHTKLSVVGVEALAILTGGGAFHCMSQEIFG